MCELNRFILAIIAALVLFLSAVCAPVYSSVGYEGSINPYLIYFRGPKLNKQLINEISKYDFVVFDRFRYHEVNKDTWSAIYLRNKGLKIFLYQLGPVVRGDTDHFDTYYLNNIGRYKKSRNHKSGDIFNNNNEWFLRNNYGFRYELGGDNYFLMDFGNPKFQMYWIESTLSDLVNRPWAANGVMVDLCVPFSIKTAGGLRGKYSKKYPDSKTWDVAMNSFIDSASARLKDANQMIMVNTGYSNTKSGFNAWKSLDNKNNPPDIALEEGAFAVAYGKNDVRFYPEEQWRRQVDLANNIHNYSVAYMSHTDLSPDETGVDSLGEKINFNQVFNFALGSYLLAKNDSGKKSYFSIDYARKIKGSYKNMYFSPVYEQLAFGQAIDGYKKESNVAIYSREFEKGIVYVNPSNTIQSIKDFKSKQYMFLDIDFIKGIKVKFNNASTIDIKPHSALFLQKVN